MQQRHDPRVEDPEVFRGQDGLVSVLAPQVADVLADRGVVPDVVEQEPLLGGGRVIGETDTADRLASVRLGLDVEEPGFVGVAGRRAGGEERLEIEVLPVGGVTAPRLQPPCGVLSKVVKRSRKVSRSTISGTRSGALVRVQGGAAVDLAVCALKRNSRAMDAFPSSGW
nr:MULTISPECIES: hypothetical protein [unclassified Streptomyces]